MSEMFNDVHSRHGEAPAPCRRPPLCASHTTHGHMSATIDSDDLPALTSSGSVHTGTSTLAVAHAQRLAGAYRHHRLSASHHHGSGTRGGSGVVVAPEGSLVSSTSSNHPPLFGSHSQRHTSISSLLVPIDAPVAVSGPPVCGPGRDGPTPVAERLVAAHTPEAQSTANPNGGHRELPPPIRGGRMLPRPHPSISCCGSPHRVDSSEEAINVSTKKDEHQTKGAEAEAVGSVQEEADNSPPVPPPLISVRSRILETSRKGQAVSRSPLFVYAAWQLPAPRSDLMARDCPAGADGSPTGSHRVPVVPLLVSFTHEGLRLHRLLPLERSLGDPRGMSLTPIPSPTAALTTDNAAAKPALSGMPSAHACEMLHASQQGHYSSAELSSPRAVPVPGRRCTTDRLALATFAPLGPPNRWQATDGPAPTPTPTAHASGRVLGGASVSAMMSGSMAVGFDRGSERHQQQALHIGGIGAWRVPSQEAASRHLGPFGGPGDFGHPPAESRLLPLRRAPAGSLEFSGWASAAAGVDVRGSFDMQSEVAPQPLLLLQSEVFAPSVTKDLDRRVSRGSQDAKSPNMSPRSDGGEDINRSGAGKGRFPSLEVSVSSYPSVIVPYRALRTAAPCFRGHCHTVTMALRRHNISAATQTALEEVLGVFPSQHTPSQQGTSTTTHTEYQHKASVSCRGVAAVTASDELISDEMRGSSIGTGLTPHSGHHDAAGGSVNNPEHTNVFNHPLPPHTTNPASTNADLHTSSRRRCLSQSWLPTIGDSSPSASQPTAAVSQLSASFTEHPRPPSINPLGAPVHHHFSDSSGPSHSQDPLHDDAHAGAVAGSMSTGAHMTLAGQPTGHAFSLPVCPYDEGDWVKKACVPTPVTAEAGGRTGEAPVNDMVEGGASRRARTGRQARISRPIIVATDDNDINEDTHALNRLDNTSTHRCTTPTTQSATASLPIPKDSSSKAANCRLGDEEVVDAAPESCGVTTAAGAGRGFGPHRPAIVLALPTIAALRRFYRELPPINPDYACSAMTYAGAAVWGTPVDSSSCPRTGGGGDNIFLNWHAVFGQPTAHRGASGPDPPGRSCMLPVSYRLPPPPPPLLLESPRQRQRWWRRQRNTKQQQHQQPVGGAFGGPRPSQSSEGGILSIVDPHWLPTPSPTDPDPTAAWLDFLQRTDVVEAHESTSVNDGYDDAHRRTSIPPAAASHPATRGGTGMSGSNSPSRAAMSALRLVDCEVFIEDLELMSGGHCRAVLPL